MEATPSHPCSFLEMVAGASTWGVTHLWKCCRWRQIRHIELIAGTSTWVVQMKGGPVTLASSWPRSELACTGRSPVSLQQAPRSRCVLGPYNTLDPHWILMYCAVLRMPAP